MHRHQSDSSSWARLVLILALLHPTHSWLPPAMLHAPHNFAPKTSLAHILLHAKKKGGQDDQQEDASSRISLSNDNKNRGKDGEQLSASIKDKAISALSQPANKKRKATSGLPQPNEKEKEDRKPSKRTTMKRSKNQMQNSSILPPSESKKKTKAMKPTSKRTAEKESSFSSLLPPPLPSLKTKESDSLSSGLSSWEEFLGRTDADTSSRSVGDDKGLLPRLGAKEPKQQRNAQKGLNADDAMQLPSISDLFPPDVTKKEPPNKATSSGQSLDGVLPVSELFYRSSQAITGEDIETTDEDSELSGDEGDDEELPFSAEQSDELTTDGNKVKIRRKRAEATAQADDSNKTNTSGKKKAKLNKRNRGQKLVRRGMEMFLGGTPINADPPQRSVELYYKAPVEGDPDSWASAITLNTLDFGPLLHTGSAESVSRVELGLFCENFVSAAMKWDVCPKDLREIVKSYALQQESPSESRALKKEAEPETATNTSSTYVEFTNGDFVSDTSVGLEKTEEMTEEEHVLSFLRNICDMENDAYPIPAFTEEKKKKKKNKLSTAAKGFGKKPKKSRGGRKNEEQRWPLVGYTLMFSIGVSKEELESGDSRDAAGSIMRGVLTRGITTFLKSKIDNLLVRVNTLKMQEEEDGTTTLEVQFFVATMKDPENLQALIDADFHRAMHSGTFALALAAAAKEETGWPEDVRYRVVEELLLEDDDVRAPWEGTELKGVNSAPTKSLESQSKTKSKPTVDTNSAASTPSGRAYAEDDMFGHEGVFFNYSEANAANAPYKGQLGPLLVDAVSARAVERPPRIISIGDVHGCIDELQDLLRLCDYRPGDQVVFLGDLVSKGPDSISVVQMAREIGAIAVRGNHDFEVIRWHQAIKAGEYNMV